MQSRDTFGCVYQINMSIEKKKKVKRNWTSCLNSRFAAPFGGTEYVGPLGLEPRTFGGVKIWRQA